MKDFEHIERERERADLWEGGLCLECLERPVAQRRRLRHGGRVERGWGVCKDRFAV